MFRIPFFLLASCLFLCSQNYPVQAAEVITILGTGQKGYTGDNGPANQASCAEPFGVVIGPDGALYVCETKNHIIRRIDLQTNIVTTVAGNGTAGYSGDGGPALKAQLNEPYEIRFDRQGNYYFVEMLNHLVRRVDAQTGQISTVAGTGEKGFSGDGGPASKARFSLPHSICFDAEQNLYVCDIGNQRVRVVSNRSGKIDTFLGNGKKAFLSDKATIGKIAVSGPRALDFDGTDLWLALREGNAVYRLNLKNKTVSHIAGLGKKQGYSGDGGPALQADLAGPKGIAIDQQGHVFIADTESHTIRRIDAQTGSITTVVGNGKVGDGPDGAPENCRLNRPHSLCIADDGRIFIGDSSNHRVRCYMP